MPRCDHRVVRVLFLMLTSAPCGCLAPRASVHYAQYLAELPDMSGKTVVVTGASRGLGFVTALSLAKKGASVLMLNRASARADAARARIADASAGAAPQLVACDLLDFESVRRAAQAVARAAPRGVDALCCNAGVMLQPDEASADGYDVTIAANALSHFLLAREIWPLLEQAASGRGGEARVVSMSSGSGFGPPALDARFFSRAGGRLGGPPASYTRYHQSKLANLVFTAALDERLRARRSRVKALACTPGVCGTDMYVHVQAQFRPGEPADLSKVPSAETARSPN